MQGFKAGDVKQVTKGAIRKQAGAYLASKYSGFWNFSWARRSWEPRQQVQQKC